MKADLMLSGKRGERLPKLGTLPVLSSPGVRPQRQDTPRPFPTFFFFDGRSTWVGQMYYKIAAAIVYFQPTGLIAWTSHSPIKTLTVCSCQCADVREPAAGLPSGISAGGRCLPFQEMAALCGDAAALKIMDAEARRNVVDSPQIDGCEMCERLGSGAFVPGTTDGYGQKGKVGALG